MAVPLCPCRGWSLVAVRWLFAALLKELRAGSFCWCHSQQLENHSFLIGGSGQCISTPTAPSEILWGSRPACKVKKCFESCSKGDHKLFGSLRCQKPVVEGDRCGPAGAWFGDQAQLSITDWGEGDDGHFAEAGPAGSCSGSGSGSCPANSALAVPQARSPGSSRLLERRRHLLHMGGEAVAHGSRVGVQLSRRPAK